MYVQYSSPTSEVSFGALPQSGQPGLFAPRSLQPSDGSHEDLDYSSTAVAGWTDLSLDVSDLQAVHAVSRVTISYFVTL